MVASGTISAAKGRIKVQIRRRQIRTTNLIYVLFPGHYVQLLGTPLNDSSEMHIGTKAGVRNLICAFASQALRATWSIHMRPR